MRTGILTLLLISFVLSTNAQEKVKEDNLTFYFKDLHHFGLQYKFGTTDAKWRFTGLYFTGNLNSFREDDDIIERVRDRGFEVRAGREWIKKIVDPLFFRLGGELSYSYINVKRDLLNEEIIRFEQNSKSYIHRPGANLVAGLTWKFAKHWALDVDVLPGLSYVRTKTIYYDESTPRLEKTNGFVSTLGSRSLSLGLSFTL